MSWTRAHAWDVRLLCIHMYTYTQTMYKEVQKGFRIQACFGEWGELKTLCANSLSIAGLQLGLWPGFLDKSSRDFGGEVSEVPVQILADHTKP